MPAIKAKIFDASTDLKIFGWTHDTNPDVGVLEDADQLNAKFTCKQAGTVQLGFKAFSGNCTNLAAMVRDCLPEVPPPPVSEPHCAVADVSTDPLDTMKVGEKMQLKAVLSQTSSDLQILGWNIDLSPGAGVLENADQLEATFTCQKAGPVQFTFKVFSGNCTTVTGPAVSCVN